MEKMDKKREFMKIRHGEGICLSGSEFEYTVTDPLGIHARPAGEITKLVRKYNAKALFEVNGKKADASAVLKLMALNIKQGDTVRISCTGDEKLILSGALYAHLLQNKF